ncbi:aspartyl protease family protein [Senna tora]|uniref:Aspartyl protease family protein n=1 Tax=Senna tora TaxID=362788 RepID=A0A834SCA7_9FABA|nr:aspartyl protease family protein [Senna tora]
MQVYAALREAFVKVMVSNKYSPAPGISILDTCFKGSIKGFVGVPEVQLVFQGGTALPLKGHNTLLEIENGITCLAIAGNPGNSPITIIGNYQQQTFDIAYDVSNSRIGFSAGGCE